MSKTTTRLNKWDTLMMAITFAEAGEYETAKDILEQTNQQRNRPETRVEQRPAMKF